MRARLGIVDVVGQEPLPTRSGGHQGAFGFVELGQAPGRFSRQRIFGIHGF